MTATLNPQTETDTAADTTTPWVARDYRAVLKLHLRELRGTRTLKAAAAAIGIRPDELSKIEQGKTRQIRWDTILRICLAYGCTIDDMLTIEPEGHSPEPDAADSPRAVMLAALHAGTGHTVPTRHLHVDDERDLPAASDAAVAAAVETPDRGVVRRRFVPAVSR